MNTQNVFNVTGSIIKCSFIYDNKQTTKTTETYHLLTPIIHWTQISHNIGPSFLHKPGSWNNKKFIVPVLQVQI